MNTAKTFLASAFCLCFCEAGFAETPDAASYEYRYRLWGGGFKQQKISYLSPLFYEGISLAGSSGKVSFRNGKLTSSCTTGDYDIFNFRSMENMVLAGGGDYAYSKYYLLPNKIDAETSSNFFVGWGYLFDWQVALKYSYLRHSNNPAYYHFNNIACLAFAVTGKIKSVHIFNELSVPVAGVYFGSEYSSTLPYFFREEDASFLGGFDILFINKDLRLKNTLNADFKLKFKRRTTTMRVQYVLNARTLRLNNNELNNFCHIFKIGYLFNANEIPYVHK
jgi:hypothetical protein